MNLTSMLPLAPSSLMMCLRAEHCPLVRCMIMERKERQAQAFVEQISASASDSVAYHPEFCEVSHTHRAHRSLMVSKSQTCTVSRPTMFPSGVMSLLFSSWFAADQRAQASQHICWVLCATIDD